MKYHVTGVDHDTGARMTLDFEATSKADAERKATKAGMEVLHAHEIHENDEHPTKDRAAHRGEASGETGALIKLLIILALIGVVVYLLWGKLRPYLYL